MSKKNDPTLEPLLELNGTRFIISLEFVHCGNYWVEFLASRVPSGIKYSLSLYSPVNKRIMWFDNVQTQEKALSHFQNDRNVQQQPYSYINSAKLLEDFWLQAHKKMDELREKFNESDT